jgi:hypothetical protein
MMYKKPVIAVVINNASAEVLKELLAGIEEEGVLFEVLKGTSKHSKELAFEASELSALNVGIGIYEKEVSLHERNIASKDMLFTTGGIYGQNIRNIGSNAARYIKGIPFKEVDR